MAKQTILTGTVANDKTGDTLRTAFTKVNANFTELYNIGVQGAQGIQGIRGAQGITGIQGAAGSGGDGLGFDSNGDLILENNLTVGGNVTVGGDNGNESHFVIDGANYWTSIQWKNFTSPQDPAAEPFECQSQLLRVFSGTNAIDGHEELVAVSAVRNNGTNYNGLMFSTSDGKIPDAPYNDGTGTRHNWILKGDGTMVLPKGGVISDTAFSTIVIAPPGAAAGQSLVIRPTSSTWSVTSSGYIVYGSPITVSVNLLSWTYFGTLNYEITGPGVTEESLGRALTGKLVFTGIQEPDSQTVTWTIPANSDITEFTFTITSVDGTRSTDIETENDPASYYNFEFNAMPTGNYVTVTNNGITNSEHSHVHLVSGDPETTDIYLGDDDQYVKIEKNGGNVVIGTNGNTNMWAFGTDGKVYFPNLTVDLHNGGTQTGQVLQFGDESHQVIITGPTPTENNNAQRLIIQGQKGSGTGEGGDVYVWAGDADTNGGDIKIYAGDADNGSSGYGGYINIDAGDGFNYGGQLTLRGGNSTERGGNVTITSGFGSTSSGDVEVYPRTGNFRIQFENSNSWMFKSNGTIVFPTNGVPSTSKGAAGDVIGSIAFGSGYIYYCIADYSNGTNDIWKRVAWSNDTW